MTIVDFIRQNEIEEILHFTTINGLTGILATSLLKSRTRLRQDQYLEYILKYNTPRVLDPAWEDYVNLSISKINTRLFSISNIHWHPTQEWRILSFSPEILQHPGVWFSTTNNAYHWHTLRGQGLAGLQKLFAPVTIGLYGHPQRREPTTPNCYPTCAQAEVLYPGELAIEYLNKIYVKSDREHDSVRGKLYTFKKNSIEVIIDPQKFE